MILVTDMHARTQAAKLRLWEAQLANSQLEHSPRLAACVQCTRPDDVNNIAPLTSDLDRDPSQFRLSHEVGPMAL